MTGEEEELRKQNRLRWKTKKLWMCSIRQTNWKQVEIWESINPGVSTATLYKQAGTQEVWV